MAYLDYNAGAAARPEVVAAMVEALAVAGNPSSVHGPGREARRRVERARSQVAHLVGARPEGVVFTSGGTEANALALNGHSAVLVSDIEHSSVLQNAPGALRIPVGSDGRADLAALEALLAAHKPSLVSLMLANNETGVIQPVAEAACLAHAAGALLHCDAAQAPGRLRLDMADLGVDLLTLSAHKMGGPAGVGALVLADPGLALAPFLLGGGQERRLRAGSENTAGIVGFGLACELAEEMDEETLGMRNMRDALEAEALRRVPEAVVVGRDSPRLPNTSCLALPGVPAAVQVMALDLAGVAVSAGSACSSGKVAASHVLAAMGLDPAIAGSAVRVSLGADSRSAHVEMFLAAWVDLARRKGFQNAAAA